MNTSDPRHPWPRLVAAARQVRDERDTAVPYGFATRVGALAFSGERIVGSLVERFALRAVGVASLLAVLSVVANYSFIKHSAPANEEVLAEDPVAALLSE
ncbi:MAG TPA: hypothetical protein VHD62_04435 [Opitutaceae bacterium]|nr:hypothetical protein [Opitutaceae bacterium]